MIVLGSLIGDAFSGITNLLGGVASSAAGDVIQIFAKSVIGSLAKAVEWISTVWVNTPTPALTDSTGTAVGTTAWVQHELLPVTGTLAVLGILVGGVRIALSERQGTDAREFAGWMITFSIASTAGVAFAAVIIEGCDALAGSLISQAVGSSDFGTQMAKSLGLVTQTVGSATLNPAGGFLIGLASTGATAMLAIVMAGAALIASLVEFGLMLLRGGVLVVLAGCIPLAAAYSNVPTGERWLRRIAGWIVALAVYKPAAAVIYAAAFMLAGGGGSAATALSGLMMLVVALLALPALLRLVMPSVEHFELHRGGAAATSTAVGAAPTGAIALATGGGAASTGGGAAGSVLAQGGGGAGVNGGPAGNPGGPSGSNPSAGPGTGGGGGGGSPAGPSPSGSSSGSSSGGTDPRPGSPAASPAVDAAGVGVGGDAARSIADRVSRVGDPPGGAAASPNGASGAPPSVPPVGPDGPAGSERA